METGHNTEEEGGLSVEVFSDSVHCLSVLWGESKISSLLNHRAEHITQASDLQQALVNLGETDCIIMISYLAAAGKVLTGSD